MFLFIQGLSHPYSFLSFRKQLVCVAEIMQAFKTQSSKRRKKKKRNVLFAHFLKNIYIHREPVCFSKLGTGSLRCECVGRAASFGVRMLLPFGILKQAR